MAESEKKKKKLGESKKPDLGTGSSIRLPQTRGTSRLPGNSPLPSPSLSRTTVNEGKPNNLKTLQNVTASKVQSENSDNSIINVNCKRMFCKCKQ